MKKWLPVCMVLLLAVTGVQAQFRGLGYSGGVGFGMNQGPTDLKNQPRFAARGFARKGLAQNLSAELGVGIQKLGAENFSTLLFPVDFRLMLSPLNAENWNPYVYLGYGTTHYEVESKPANASKGAVLSGWAGSFPMGVGIAANLVPTVNVELTGGYNRTATADLDAVRTSSKDSYWNVMLNFVSLVVSGDSDTDGDGLTNDQEKELGTNPDVADTDGDGLSDGAEANTYKTSPKLADSDGDGLSDKDEIMTYKTDANLADTDGDGIKDGEEINKLHTDALKSDTDGDGLSDGEEVQKYKTDPLKTDSDNGTVSDGDEVKRGSNPLLASDDVPPAPKEEVKAPEPPKEEPKTDIAKIEKGESLVLEGILFESGSATISNSSELTLATVATTMQAHPEMEIEVQGHTDNLGKEASNKKLSQRRADAVRSYLVKHGVDKKRIIALGYGSEKPVTSNDTDEGRHKNRRIEFKRTK